ncbi:MAG: hypothetical protein HYX56_02720 [Chloroflexi bacterium]|nr:hypothetical protein [Chloroflexota bacterium]
MNDELDPADISVVAEALPLREPPDRLKDRILLAARADAAPRVAVVPFFSRLRLPDLRVAALAAAVVLLIGVDATAVMRLRAVLFHDLRDLPAGQVYTLWMISADGGWARGASFRPDGADLPIVAVGLDIAGFDRCVVTVETSTSGKRQGPIVMQSRLAPAQ